MADTPAFPLPEYIHPDDAGYCGMTLRDWFAGGIANGLSAHSETAGLAYGPGEIARRSYEIADAMLAERAKGSDK